MKDAKIQIGPVPLQVFPEFNNLLQQYSEAWLLLTSLEGRKWIREHLDSLLDYIEKLVRSE